MTGDYVYEVNLIFVVSCPVCAEARTPLPSGACASCGHQLPVDLVAIVRDAIKLRRQAFKGRLIKLAERMKVVEIDASTFVTRGTPSTPDDYRDQVLRPHIKELPLRGATVARILSDTQWDDAAGNRIGQFNELVGLLEAGLTAVVALAKMMPPLEWRAAHRGLTRSMLSQLRGQIMIALTLSASDAAASRDLQEEGQRAFDAGLRQAEWVAALVRLASLAPSDSPFQADGSVDIATLAWDYVGKEATSIAQGAEIALAAYKDVPGIDDLPEYYAVLLLPLLATSGRVADHDLLMARTKQLRQVLDGPSGTADWLIDPELLVVRMRRGMIQINQMTERLGREWRANLPRDHIANSLAEIYLKLVERAFLDLGSIILVAARAERGDSDNGSYEKAVVDGIKAGEIASELDAMGGSCANAVDMLYRNANAHASIEITATGIIATERVIKNHREEAFTTVELSDAEFAEEIVSLHETLVAFQLTIITWAWGRSELSTLMMTLRPDQSEIAQGLGLLGGVAGLRDVKCSIEDDHFTIAASLREGGSQNESGILSLVPAAFGFSPDVNRVTLGITGWRPVAYDRAEFDALEPDKSPHKPVMLGLITAKWLFQSGSHWSPYDEATYVTLQLTAMHVASMELAISTPQRTENIESAVASLQLAKSRLDEVLPVEKRSSLTKRAVAQLDILTRALAGIAEGRRGRIPVSQMQRFGQQAAATVNVVDFIREEGKHLRDRALASS
jgi:hypothetical protein